MYSLSSKLIRVGWISHFWLLNDTHFVWLGALTMLVNNAINVFLITRNIILYAFFIKYLSVFVISIISKVLIKKKIVHQGFIQALWIMSVLWKKIELFKEKTILVSSIVTWNGKLKLKKVIKFWTAKWVNSQRHLKKVFCLWQIFLQEFAIHSYKGLLQAENF